MAAPRPPHAHALEQDKLIERKIDTDNLFTRNNPPKVQKPSEKPSQTPPSKSSGYANSFAGSNGLKGLPIDIHAYLGMGKGDDIRIPTRK